jgi:uncharacterized protein
LSAAEVLLVLLRSPRAGQVKTRLAAAVGPEGAARAYARMSREVLDAVRTWDRPGVRRVALVTPPEAVVSMADELAPALEPEAQVEGDLGARLSAAFGAAFAGGAARVVAVGTDCPALRPRHLDAAFAALGAVDAVLGPARDGGYWLVGLARPTPDAFRDVPWGRPSVLAVTLGRLAEAARRTVLLEELRDLDTLADLRAAGRTDLLAP